MSTILNFYLKDKRTLVIFAVLAILCGWLAYHENPTDRGGLYYSLHVIAIVSDVFKSAINLVVPMLVSTAILLVAAGGVKPLLASGGAAGKKMAFITTGFLGFTTPLVCIFAVILLQFINPADPHSLTSQVIPSNTAFITSGVERLKKEEMSNIPFSEFFLERKQKELEGQGVYAVPQSVEKHAALQVREKVKNTFNMNLIRDLGFGNMLQLVFGVLVFGFAVKFIRLYKGNDDDELAYKRGAESFVQIVGAVMQASIKILMAIMVLVPFVIFGLVSTSIAESGLSVLVSLGGFVVTFLFMLFLWVFGFYSLMLKLFGVSPSAFFKSRKELMIQAFTTSSSSAVMATSIKTAVDNGVDQETANIGIPLGTTVNMDGTAMYQIFIAMYLMFTYGFDVGLVAMLPIVVSIVLASMGTPGAPGASIFILIPILAAMGIDESAVLLLLAVDRPLDMCRTVCNVLGDQMIVSVTSKWFSGEDIPLRKILPFKR
ncbi:MAG: Na+/H+-dicarboxylate symporter [Alphaproteobacteria bacterium]|jgi:Na+/H+-dicarboxylate symporter